MENVSCEVVRIFLVELVQKIESQVRNPINLFFNKAM